MRTKIPRDAWYDLQELNRSFNFWFGPQAHPSSVALCAPVDTRFSPKAIHSLQILRYAFECSSMICSDFVLDDTSVSSPQACFIFI